MGTRTVPGGHNQVRRRRPKVEAADRNASAGGDQLLDITRGAAVAADPGEEPFGRPSALLDLKGDLIGGLAQDFDSDAGG